MNEQSTFRTRHGKDRPYFALRQDTARDSRISFEARGMLAYLLSKPDNWQVKINDLMKNGDIGREKTFRILNELKTAGYIIQEKQRKNADGTFARVEYRIYEEPHTENPSTADPYTENQHALSSTESPSTESLKETLAPGVADAVSPELDDKPVNGQGSTATPPGPDPQPNPQPLPEDKAKPRNEWYDVIAETFKAEGWRNGKIGNILRGTAKGNEAKFNLDQPLTDTAQVRTFWAWYQKVCEGCSLVDSAAVQDYVMRWQKELVALPTRPRPLEPNEAPPPDPIYPGI
jgi:hypothetical protein